MSKRGIVYAYNFVPLGTDGTLVKCAASNDTIGVLRLDPIKPEWLAFYRNGVRVIRTKSWTALFRAIHKTDRAS
jgi:hypothetical protein